jgi:signal transduction histidine kinase
MRWSIRYQLLVPLLTLLLGVVGISTWTGVSSANHARQQLEAQVHDVARTLLSDPPVPISQTVLEQMKGLSGAEYLVLVYGADGQEDRRQRLATFPAADVAPPLEAVSDDWQSLRLGPKLTVQETTYLCAGVRLQRSNTGKVLFILYPEALWRDALWQAIRPSLVLGLFGGIASLVLALGVAQRLGRRIQELERRTRQIAAGDFSPMPLPGRNDELRDLSQSINDMAQRLAQLQEAVCKTERLRLLGQVSGGLAHQLRNAVTGARLAVQLHARECNGRTDPETLDVALRQLTLLETNLKRFLDLGHADAPKRENCSLTRLIDETVGLFRPQCRHAHVELAWQPPDNDLIIPADPGQLGHLLSNVLGNAVEAAGPGGAVEVRLQRWPIADGRAPVEPRQAPSSARSARPVARIEVLDTGPGPPAEVADRLFEPFVTSKRDGVGLGLAVAQQVARAHGGQIDWHREANRTCFRIELPAGDAP